MNRLTNFCLDYRIRYAITLTISFGCLASLYVHDAPQWAYAFVVFAATMTSRLDSIADANAMQSTVRTHVDPLRAEVAQLREALRLMYEGGAK